MSNVHTLQPVSVGERFRFDPDETLEAAKGQAFATVAVIGHYEDGTIWVSSSANSGETYILLDLAKAEIIRMVTE